MAELHAGLEDQALRDCLVKVDRMSMNMHRTPRSPKPSTTNSVPKTSEGPLNLDPLVRRVSYRTPRTLLLVTPLMMTS